MKDTTLIINNVIYIMFIITVITFMYYMITEHQTRNKAVQFCETQDNNKTQLYTYTREGFSTQPKNIICTDNITFEITGDLMKRKLCDQELTINYN